MFDTPRLPHHVSRSYRVHYDHPLRVVLAKERAEVVIERAQFTDFLVLSACVVDRTPIRSLGHSSHECPIALNANRIDLEKDRLSKFFPDRNPVHRRARLPVSRSYGQLPSKRRTTTSSPT